MKKIILMTAISLFVSSAFAETMPTYNNLKPSSIKNKNTLTLPPPPPDFKLPQLPDINLLIPVSIDLKITRNDKFIHGGTINTIVGIIGNLDYRVNHTYFEKVEVINGVNVLTPGVITDGLSVSVLPNIVPGKKDFFELDIHLQEHNLTSIKEMQIGKEKIGMPNVDLINIKQNFPIENNTTKEVIIASSLDVDNPNQQTVYKLIISIKKD